MAGPESAPMLPPRPRQVSNEQTSGTSSETGQPFRLHLVDGKPMMSREDLARIEAARARAGVSSTVAPVSREAQDDNVIEHTVTNRVKLPSGMDPTVRGVLGAIIASPETAQLVARGIGTGIANFQAQQTANTQTPQYYHAERTPEQTASAREDTKEQSYVPARVAGYPYSANDDRASAVTNSTEAPSATRRAIGAIVTAGMLAAAVWIPVTATLSRFGKGDIKSQTPLTMEWGEVPDKFMAILHNPGLIAIADRGENK